MGVVGSAEPSADATDESRAGWRVRLRHAAARVVLARRALVPFLLAAIGVATVAVIAAVALARQAPSWWRVVDAENPATVQLAEAVERGVVNTLHSGRSGEDAWTVSIAPEQANAWLNARLPRWLENRSIAWPSELREVQCDFSGEAVRIGARLGGDRGAGQIVVARVEPRIEGGALWLRLTGARAGRLELPAGWTIARLRARLGEEARGREPLEGLLRALAGEAPLFDDAVVRLEDGRRVRLLEARVAGGKLLLTCRTE